MQHEENSFGMSIKIHTEKKPNKLFLLPLSNHQQQKKSQKRQSAHTQSIQKEIKQKKIIYPFHRLPFLLMKMLYN